MPEAIVVTPVKDSLAKWKRAVKAVIQADGDFEYVIFNNFSLNETKDFLNMTSAEKDIF